MKYIEEEKQDIILFFKIVYCFVCSYFVFLFYVSRTFNCISIALTHYIVIVRHHKPSPFTQTIKKIIYDMVRLKEKYLRITI